MKGRKPNFSSSQRDWVHQWWAALQPRAPGDARPAGILASFDRGTRARLRRLTDPVDLSSEPATLILASRLIQIGGNRWPLLDEPATYLNLACVAGSLARVKRDSRSKEERGDSRTLAVHLGEAPQGSERPVMSEIRFRRLQNARDSSELFLQVRRAVELVESTDVAQLADDLLTWLAELQLPSGRGRGSVRFHWAYDYYLSPSDRLAAKDPILEKE